ncbi:DUF4145 domain-containing protein [Sinimarinibacterium flocculans]|uniref:DUF4145 domain-containing protein n=1 Tax=Sinimarinibacterium flocculans TaxID=985250 RepID=UPI0035143686
MREKYYPAVHAQQHFHCPRCHVYAEQTWHLLQVNVGYKLLESGFTAALCSHCQQRSFWYDGRMVVPSASTGEPAHPDLPADCLSDYEEALEIVARSPRGASALLRLTLQKLMVHLGESGKNINDDIKALVKKGLPGLVQQALDVCRVVGNNAVHPGELDIQDTPEIAYSLFRMINFIVDDRISRPKEIQQLYGQLPEATRSAISKRDGGA